MDESLREKWTEETVMRIYVNGGGEPSGFNKGFKAIADAHNATLQPHDCGEVKE